MASRSLAIVQATDADVLVKTGSGFYSGTALLAAAADSTAKVYDSATVAGVANTKLIDVIGIDVSLEGSNSSKANSPTEPTRFKDGLVIVLTGAGAIATIRYK